jgi:hypothetical protein
VGAIVPMQVNPQGSSAPEGCPSAVHSPRDPRERLLSLRSNAGVEHRQHPAHQTVWKGGSCCSCGLHYFQVERQS